MNSPLVSIVIVNYNYGRFLRAAIDSALGQLYRHIEVLIVDDGSSDGSVEVIRSYGNRIRSVIKSNGGHGSCINAGFTASRGDLVLFLDADDSYLPDAVQEVVCAARCGAAMIHFRLNLVDVHGRFIAEYPWRRVRLDSGDVTPVLVSRGKFTCMVSTGNAFRRDVLDRVLPLDDKAYARAPDGYLVNSVPFFGEVAAIERPLGCYRIHGSNDSINYKQSLGLDVEKIRSLLGFSTRELRLVQDQATRHGIAVARNLPLRHMRHVQLRLISYTLAPHSHAFPEDSAVGLGLAGVRAAFLDRGLPWERRLLMASWFLAVGFLPRRLGQYLIKLVMATK